MMKQTMAIDTPYIRLDAALKLVGAAATGGQAKTMIQAGNVTVDGQICTQRGRKLTVGTTFAVVGEAVEYEVTEDR